MGMDRLAHVLVVDDARDIREPLAQFLKANGFAVSVAESAAVARRQLKGVASISSSSIS